MQPDQFAQIVQIIVSILVGLVGMPLAQYAKTKMNLEGTPAMVLVLAISFILSLLQFWLAGMFVAAAFTPEAFFGTFMTIYGSALFFYQVIVKANKPPEFPDYDPNQFGPQ